MEFWLCPFGLLPWYPALPFPPQQTNQAGNGSSHCCWDRNMLCSVRNKVQWDCCQRKHDTTSVKLTWRLLTIVRNNVQEECCPYAQMVKVLFWYNLSQKEQAPAVDTDQNLHWHQLVDYHLVVGQKGQQIKGNKLWNWEKCGCRICNSWAVHQNSLLITNGAVIAGGTREPHSVVVSLGFTCQMMFPLVHCPLCDCHQQETQIRTCIDTMVDYHLVVRQKGQLIKGNKLWNWEKCGCRI